MQFQPTALPNWHAAVTVTVADSSVTLVILLTTSVKTVVAVGDTTMLLPVTVPIPGKIWKVVPATGHQLSVLLPPGAIVDGVA